MIERRKEEETYEEDKYQQPKNASLAA